MSDLEPHSGGGILAATGSVLVKAVRYTVVIAQLTAAGLALRGLSEQVRRTYEYVEGCAKSVDRLAEQMAVLSVDRDTVAEHHEAAAVMRSVREEAEAMAAEAEDLAVLFHQAADGHEGDYGTVAEAANSMPGGIDMAEAEFYSNR